MERNVSIFDKLGNKAIAEVGKSLEVLAMFS